MSDTGVPWAVNWDGVNPPEDGFIWNQRVADRIRQIEQDALNGDAGAIRLLTYLAVDALAQWDKERLLNLNGSLYQQVKFWRTLAFQANTL